MHGNEKRNGIFLCVDYQCGQGFSLSFGRFPQLSVSQQGGYTVYKEPSIRMKYILQFIRFNLSKVYRN